MAELHHAEVCNDRYERAPTRGRPSAGPRGNRWQTRRLNSLNSRIDPCAGLPPVAWRRTNYGATPCKHIPQYYTVANPRIKT